MGEPTPPEGAVTLENLAEKGVKPDLTALQRVAQAKEALHQAHTEALVELDGVVADASKLGIDVSSLLPVVSSETEGFEIDGKKGIKRIVTRRGDLIAPDGSRTTFAVSEIDDFPEGSHPEPNARGSGREVNVDELLTDIDGGQRLAVRDISAFLRSPSLSYLRPDGSESRFFISRNQGELGMSPQRAPAGIDLLATARERVSYLSDHRGELTVPDQKGGTQIASTPSPVPSV